MDFEDFVRVHHLTVCTVNEIICEHCFRVVVLSGDTLPRMIPCPGCGNAARAVKRIRVRAATSRPLPRVEILKAGNSRVVLRSRSGPSALQTESAEGKQLST